MAPPAKKRSRGIWLWLFVPPLLVVAMPTFILLLLGMLPTLVAGVVDRRPERYTAYCVGGFNLCGVLPYLIDLWAGRDSMMALSPILSRPVNWLVMFGAAAVGWIVFHWTPQVMIRLAALRDRRAIASMKRRQEELVEEWGNELLPPDELGLGN